MENKRKKLRIESEEEEEEDISVNNNNNNDNEEELEADSKTGETAPSPKAATSPDGPQQADEEEEDIDNLFGDDDEEEEEDNRALDSKPADENGIVADDDGDEDDFRRNDGLEFAVEENKPQRELRSIDLDVVRHPPKFQHEDGKLYDAKIPNFLEVDPTRFEGKPYLEKLINDAKKLDQDEIELNRLKAENTIRWRYAKDSNGELINESNAQVIEWSDGSFSLKLGDEYFDVIQSELTDTFLATYSEESGLLTTDGLFTNSMKIVPTSTNSKIHKKLTTAIQARQQTKPGAQSVYVDKDPEEEARALERQQDQLIRERRRKELKERKENERYDSDTPRPSQRAARESYYSTPRMRDEYEEDAFMVDDDEEVEEDDEEDDLEAAERLRRVKNEGAAKYRDSNNDDEGDDEEDAEQEEDADADDDEANAKARKKRRVIESDEDEE